MTASGTARATFPSPTLWVHRRKTAILPRQPFTLLVGSDHTSNTEEGYCKLFIPCGGADDPRPIKLRRKGSGQWFLWEQYLMTGIRVPLSADPWA